MIIERYLKREILHTLFAVTSVLLFIFLSRQLVRYLSQAAAGKLSAKALFVLLSLQVPHLLSVLLPLSLFLAILLAFSRMYVDQEMTVLFACGFSNRQLFAITTRFAIWIVLIVALLTLWLNPWVKKEIDKRTQQARSGSVLEYMQQGRFRESSNGKRIYYLEKMARGHQDMKGVFIAESHQEGTAIAPWSILTADGVTEEQDSADKQSYMVFHRGYRVTGTPGERDFRVMYFGQYRVRLEEKPVVPTEREEVASTWQLLLMPNMFSKMKAELHWRLALPLSAFMLALLAIPLSRVKPRQGRYARLLPAILIYLVYVNLLFIGRHQIVKHIVPAWFGLWWIHLLFLGLLGLLLIQNPRTLFKKT